MVDSTENFVEYGTPLDPLEEDAVPSKKPVTVQDQIAVDDQGRRRFHGAFTGGFSAGYYNTVGSKEGWTPSEFKSSRQNRAENKVGKGQNAQDFMDEEDLGAFGIAPQILRATTDFEQRESRKRTRPSPESGPIPGIPILEQIIQPVKDTIGIRILQRMGWRSGQGIGPRLTKRERALEREKHEEKKRLKAESSNKKVTDSNEDKESDVKTYGCYIPPEFRRAQEDSDSEDSIIDISKVTFAPDDFEDPLCNPKENTFGLGYTGLDRSALSFGTIDLFGANSGIKSRVENRKLNIRGEAFGVGAFEDADEEVYHRSDMSQYDFSLETPKERKERLGNDRRDKHKNATKTESGVLSGFLRAKNPPPLRKFFPAPPLPKNFEPKHYIRRSRFDQPPPVAVEQAATKKMGLDRHRLTIEERQVMIGEEKIPLTPQEQKEMEAKAKEEEEKAKKQSLLEKAERLRKFTEVLQTYTANKAPPQAESGAGFKPFMKNPEKQERYEKYITLVAAGFPECLKDLQPITMTEWERERERMEFERASALYRPMGSIISSRFVSAQSHDISHLVPIKEIQQEKDPVQDPKVASKMGLFGKLTHKVYEWHPDRLLCRRFNVPHPYPDSKVVGVIRRDVYQTSAKSLGATGKTDDNQSEVETKPPSLPVKKSLFDNLDFSKPPPGLLPVQPIITSSKEDICPPGTEPDQGERQLKPTQGEIASRPISADETTITRPPIDLFKEIFENSSSDEDEDEEPPKPPMPPHLSASTSSKPSHFENIATKSSRESRSHRDHDHQSDNHEKKLNRDKTNPEHSNDAPKSKGIFDNLDFSKLNESNPRKIDRVDGKEERKRSVVPIPKEKMNDADAEVDVDIYGPLPPRHSTSIKSPVSKDGQRKHDFSKDNKGISINSTLVSSSGRRKIEDDDEVMWVEVEKGNGTQEKRKSSSSGNVSKEKKQKTHKQKKLKKGHRHRTSSSSKGKKPKKRKEKKSKKRHKRNSSTETSSGSEDETETGSSSEDSTIQIHQSFNNKALLSKLREITRSK